MGSFRYRGVTFSGETAAGTVRVSDVETLAEHLRARGILVVDVKRSSASGYLDRVLAGRRHETAVTRYFRNLATLVGAGVPLSRALDGLADRAQGRSWSQVTRDVAEGVRNGFSLAVALESREDVFSGVAIPMIAAAEMAGTLAAVLERVAASREKWETVNRKMRAALVYPAVVSLVALAVIWIMLTHVVPVFAQMFTNLGSELPRPTRILLQLSAFLKLWWWTVPVLTVSAVALWKVAARKPDLQLRASRWGLQLPLIGNMLGRVAVARFSRTTATLLENGVALLPALRTAAKTARNRAVERIFLDAAQAVEQGQPLSTPLAGVSLLPPLAAQILSTGEETANLGRMFGKLADFYEAEADAMIGMVTSVIEPALVVVMGIIVAGILISLYLPMFDVLSQIGG